MRRLTPSYVVTSVAIALASTAALAQLRIQAAPGAGTTASTTASSTAPQASTTTSGPGEITPPTPLFDLTARQGAEREARRRARGEEPRVYGIAPRTDRDLTHQMPDDPVIRY
jgi:hypothetical protein